GVLVGFRHGSMPWTSALSSLRASLAMIAPYPRVRGRGRVVLWVERRRRDRRDTAPSGPAVSRRERACSCPRDLSGSAPMRRATAGVLLLGAVSTCLPGLVFPVGAQDRGALYRSVNPSVVVIRARGRDVEASGLTRFLETGSGVLVSADGKVMTAAHVVQAM